MEELAEQGVATRHGVMAIHQEPLYRERGARHSSVETERAAAETLLLPLYADMTDAEQDTVVKALKAALAR
jgi:perosamine synthetase